ncbi:hypothetical protein B0H11DRAFT_1939353 [Mycena galericulata]|nr:hypothetical protein B0H11DRAFT_1939353 [Mycena galericulata]
MATPQPLATFDPVQNPTSTQCVNENQVLAAAGIINHGLEVARHARGQAFNIRTNRQPKPNALAATPPQPTVDLNTAALDQFRNVGYNDADCIKVYAEARLDTNAKVNMRLGQTSRSYPPDTFMDGKCLSNLWLREGTVNC